VLIGQSVCLAYALSPLKKVLPFHPSRNAYTDQKSMHYRAALTENIVCIESPGLQFT
jgi:hypothetical protein